jgi:hypothetical protein
VKYTVNDITLSYEAVGNRGFGTDKVLLKDAVDLTANSSWHDRGFVVKSLFDEKINNAFFEATEYLLKSLWRKSGLQFDDNLPLQEYHKVAKTREQHLGAVDLTKLLDVLNFPLGIQKIEERIGELCGSQLVARNPYDSQAVFHFRVIRPKSGDNNPLHRDVWLEDYADCINLYIPVCGSNERSSLIIVPGSHLWSESRVERTAAGAHINGVKFNVPAVTDIAGNFSCVRPDPVLGEVLVFSPYLLHGGAVNLNDDLTRISMELRLWKK